MSTKQDTRPRQNGRGDKQPPVKVEVTPGQVAEAQAHEEAIAGEARAIWDAASTEGELTRKLFIQLLPLLRRPIPEGFISEVTSGTGKPYDSKGVKSMQVQIDRLDNVLTPLHWGWETVHSNDGQLATVIAWIGPKADPFVQRVARGGINRLDYGQTVGNLYKGTETNAGKLALARLGVGHDVYVGLTDFDPDVSEEAREAQAREPVETVGAVESPKFLNAEQVKRVEKGIADAGLSEHLPMKLRSLGLEGLTVGEVTAEHATALYEWVHGADTPESKGESDG